MLILRGLCIYDHTECLEKDCDCNIGCCCSTLRFNTTKKSSTAIYVYLLVPAT